jgi:hypothetical protein
MLTDDAQFAELVEAHREPTRNELAALMRTYLEGPIDDDTVERLEKQVYALSADRERWKAEGSAFRGNSSRYHGQAWKELLSPHEHRPSPAELALWLAIVTPGYPPPRWLCPAELCGRWEQAAPNAASWDLADNGQFSTTEPRMGSPNTTRWCVHLVARRGDLRRDQLWLTGDVRHVVSRTSLIILECTADRLRLLRAGGDFGDVEFTLIR